MLLEEERVVDPVGVALHGQGPVPKMGQHDLGHPGVVVDDLPLGESGGGVEDLVEVGDGQLPPVDGGAHRAVRAHDGRPLPTCRAGGRATPDGGGGRPGSIRRSGPRPPASGETQVALLLDRRRGGGVERAGGPRQPLEVSEQLGPGRVGEPGPHLAHEGQLPASRSTAVRAGGRRSRRGGSPSPR